MILNYPKEAFSALSDKKAFGLSSEQFLKLLLKEAQFVAVPRPAFGSHDEG